MEDVVKKYQQKYRKVREEMAKWDVLQSCLLSQFGNAASIIERLPMLMDSKNHGVFRRFNGIKEMLVGKQMEALERIFSSMKDTMKEFNAIVLFLQKISRDNQQKQKGGSSLLTQQMQLRIGIRPSIAMCVDGLKEIYDMHQSEYLLKKSIISALTLKSSSIDIAALSRMLADQPNIPQDEVPPSISTTCCCNCSSCLLKTKVGLQMACKSHLNQLANLGGDTTSVPLCMVGDFQRLLSCCQRALDGECKQANNHHCVHCISQDICS